MSQFEIHLLLLLLNFICISFAHAVSQHFKSCQMYTSTAEVSSFRQLLEICTVLVGKD